MKRKGFGRRRPWCDRGTIPELPQSHLEKPRNKSGKLDVQTLELALPEYKFHYPYTNLLSGKPFIECSC
jgi:hypothetical protein